MRILLADDDLEVRETLGIVLRRDGYTVIPAASGAEAWALFQSERPDMAILDINMGEPNGIELTRRINEDPDNRAPVIILTGREAENDKVRVLDLGADDYLIKPFSAREVLARIRAVFRRARVAAPVITLGPLTLDTRTHSVTHQGQPVDLTTLQFVLLRLLMEQAGQVVTGDTIMRRVWGEVVSDDLLRVTVFRLRRKIEDDPRRPRYIHTVAGVGFTLRIDRDADGASPSL